MGNWDGAACWGRLLNQNYVRMNMTSTTSWSLIWSVYQNGFPYFGNGLMYAMTPWSGHYEAGQDGTDNGAAIWTNAHTCQFVEVGWKYLATGAGAGMLAGGGSYVTLVDPTGSAHFTLVLEKLEGRCLRCAGQTTSSETVKLVLGGGLDKMAKAAGKLQLWRTNLTHRFINEGDVHIGIDDSIEVFVGKDSIVTVSSWYNGQAKVMPQIPDDTPFMLPYSDNFDSYKVDSEARYFADNGGSFQIAAAPSLSLARGGSRSGMVMKQWVTNENGVNRWAGNVPPISLIGNASWADVTVSVDVLVEKSGVAPVPHPTPPPTPPSAFQHWQSKYNDECLDVTGKLTQDGAAVDTWTCVSAKNEAFSYDSSSGQFVDENSQKCMTTQSCNKNSLCIGKCGEAAAQWTIGSDHTIRPKATPTSCLQVATKVLDATLSLGACASPPNDHQIWMNTTVTPSPGPAGGAYAGTCVRTDRSGHGVCLTLSASGDWALSGTAAKGKVSKDPTKEWTKLGITAKGGVITASIDGKPQPPVEALPLKYEENRYGIAAAAGMVSINSGYNVAYFDNFEVQGS